MARIIEFEGLDNSFKETNSKKLKDWLSDLGYNVYLFSFPNYGNESSFFVEKFLNNKFKFNFGPNDALAIADFYALDRYITYKESIEDIYKNNDDNTIIIFDRWIYSNIPYQLARKYMDGRQLKYNELVIFTARMINNEIYVFNLPRADLVLFMRMPYSINEILLNQKKGKDANELNKTLLKNASNFSDIVFDKIIPSQIIELYDVGNKCVKSEDNIFSLVKESVYNFLQKGE